MTATTVARERPILFSGPMVRAILDGRKTQTRRVMKPQPVRSMLVGQPMWGHKELGGDFGEHIFGACAVKMMACPYGEPGDHLWVRETWANLQGAGFDKPVAYLADNTRPAYSGGPLVEDGDSKRARLDYGVRWTPSIHMPRWACRLTLEVTEVRVERVQAINERDAAAEGAPFDAGGNEELGVGYRIGFMGLWNDLNAKRGYGWDVNPWVWVVSFRRACAP